MRRCCPFCDAGEDRLYVEDIASDAQGRRLWAVICAGCAASGPMVPGDAAAAWQAWEFHGAGGAAFFSGRVRQ